ncbi:MAG TPA: hypothetical protein VGM56_01395 [Byssovorax sp.]
MRLAPLAAYAPYAWTAALALAFALLLRELLRRGVRARPILLAGFLLASLPALYAALAWVRLVPELYLRLARPWAAAAGVFATWFIAVRLANHPARITPWRRRVGDAIVQLAACAAALAAAGPEIGRPLDRLTIIVAVDRSRSIDLVPGAEPRIARELSVAELGMREEDRIGVVSFGADALTEDPPRLKSQLAAPQRASVGRDGTDLAGAIRRALADVPPDSAARVVLVSDGVATRGDTLAAAAAALASEIPVDVLPLEQRAVPDVRVVSMRAPTRADEGESLDLRVVTSSSAAADVEVRVKRDGEVIARANAKIAAGEDVLRVKEIAPGPGLHRYDVEITALDPKLDQAPEDNTASAFVRVRGSAAALVLEGDPGQGAFVARALEAAAFRVDQATGAGVPADLGALAAYDVVFLSDVRASDLAPSQIDALASYVRDLGGGLVLMGGDRSMGPGGYARTSLEEVSPVSFDIKQDRRRASLAEVIGIDISGSMGADAGGGHNKLDLANEAAARSAALLGPGDMLGVEHVDTAVMWSVPLGPVVDKAQIDAKIRGVGVGGGGIYVDITLDAGYEALGAAKVNLKHMLLFADGSDAERNAGCDPKVASAFQHGITTSVVALGNGSDVPRLEHLSALGHGRFYVIEDATRLPAVFTQETILAARSSLYEKPFRAKVGAPGAVTSGIDFGEAPELKGYVITIPKPRASVHLLGTDGDPLLATWSAGIGRAAAFTSDLKDRWGAAWTTWPGASRMVAQVARDVSRRGEDARVRLEADAVGGSLHVRATVIGDDGRAQSFRRLVTHVAGPDGFAREIALEATGAGTYAADLPLARPGTYVAVARDEQSGQAVGTTGAVLTAGEELRPTGSDVALLTRVAEFTGGRRRDTLAGIFGDRATRRFAYEDLTSMLVVVAALTLLFAVGARRLSPPLWLVQWFEGLRRAAPSPVAVGPEAALALLQSKRARAAAQPTPPPVDVRVPAPAPRAAPVARAAPIASQAPKATAPPTDAPLPPPADAPPASSRPLTAAEILLARRKGRR